MLVNKAEIARKVLSGEISDTESLNAVLRSMIKEVAETAMGRKSLIFWAMRKIKLQVMVK